MSISLSVAISAVPSRLYNIRDYIIPRIDKSLVTDLQVFWDTEFNGCWWNAKRCLQAASGTHHLVMADDTQLCRNFIPSVLKAIEANPDAPISWYCNDNPALNSAINAKSHWLIYTGGLLGLCYSMPTPMVRDFLLWEDKHITKTSTDSFVKDRDDSRISMFLDRNNIDLWVCAPSLTNHGGSGKASVIGHKGSTTPMHLAYKATWARDEDPLQWDWTVPTNPKRRKMDLSCFDQFYIP